MAKKLFEINPKIPREQMLKAIYELELKRWEKDRSGAKPSMADVTDGFGKLAAADALIAYATRGKRQKMPAANEVLAEDEAKAIGAVLLQVEKDNEAKGIIHPEVTVTGSNKKPYKLEPKELSAWLQANAEAGEVVAADTWARERKVGLTAHGSDMKNGKEDLYFEIHEGQSRVVGNGTVTEPMEGYYGGVKGTKSADGDLLDVYVSGKIHDDMREGKAYDGPVFVMQQMDKGKTDELKIGYAADVDEFRRMQTSTWDDPAEFAEKNEGKYIELTQDQYKQLKAALAKDPRLTLEQFVEQAGLKMADVERAPQTAAEPDERVLGQSRAAVAGVQGMGTAGDEGDALAPPPRGKPAAKAPQGMARPPSASSR